MSETPLRSESPGGWFRKQFGRRGKKPDTTKGAQTNPESEEERRQRVEQLVHKAVLDSEKGIEYMSLLQGSVDGQWAMDEIWKLLFRSSTSRNDRGDDGHREVLKRLLLNLITRFSTLPVGPVFTEAVETCPDPSRHPQLRDRQPAQEPRDSESHARIQIFLEEALQQDHVDDPVEALPRDVSGQDVVDESWNMLTYGNLPDDQRDKIRRLCLKLVLGLNTVPHGMELPDVQYAESDLLGAGSFADVFRGRSQGGVVAVKRLREFIKMTDTQRQDLLRSLHREAFLWKLLDHQYILPLLGVSNAGQRDQMVTLVSPLAANGGIRDYIRKLQSQGALPTSGPDFVKHVCLWLHQVSVGLAYLHGQGIVHGDLHCGNILVNAAGDIQLTDFGLALIADATSYNYASVHGGGALFTRAPELLDPQAITTRQTPACDVYAFAFLCFELFTGQRAFPEVPEVQVPGLILNRKRPSRPPEFGDNATHDLVWSLIVTCWSTPPDWRPPASYVSNVMEKIVDDENGKAPPFTSEEIWRFEPMGGHLTISNDYLVCNRNGTMDVHSVSSGKLLHRLHGRQEGERVACTGQFMITSYYDLTLIWSLVTGKCLHVFECDGRRGLSVTNPEMVDAEDSGVVEGRDPSRIPLIVALQQGHVAVLTFPPLHHRLDGPEPKAVAAEDSPFLKHRLHHGRFSVNLIAQENIAVLVQVSSFELEVWDIVTGQKRWTDQWDRDSSDDTIETRARTVARASLDVSRGIVAVSFGTSARIYNVHTGEILHTLNSSHLSHIRCQKSFSSFLSLTDESFFILWDPFSRSPNRPLFLPAALSHPNPKGPIFVHDHRHALFAGPHGINVVDIRTGFTLGTLPIDIDSEVKSLYLKGQLCAVALRTKIGPDQLVIRRFGADEHLSVSESGYMAWEDCHRRPY